MRLLADENFPGDAVKALRQAGHDVLWMITESPGDKDPAVLKRAIAESRILMTFDKDFGELAFRANLPATCGIILFRLAMTSPATVTKIALEVLSSRDDWQGHFSVIEAGQIRMTPLPTPPPPDDKLTE